MAAQTTVDDPQIEAGHRLLQANRCDEAATTLRAAWESGRRPRALAELGLAEACLSRWIEAETNLAQALATPDEWVTRNRTTLEETVEQVRGRLATIVVEVVGPDADDTEVFVDGRVRGRPGQELRVVAGAIVVEVRAEGFAHGRRSLEVPARQRARERFELVPSAAATHDQPAAGHDRRSPRSSPSRRGRASSDGSGTRRLLGWIGLAGAGVAAGVAVTGLALRESNLATWNDDSLCNSVAGLDRDQECPSEGDAWRLGEAMMWVGVVGSGVLAAGSLVLLLTASSSDPDDDTRLAVGCAPTLGGATCALRVW